MQAPTVHTNADQLAAEMVTYFKENITREELAVFVACSMDSLMSSKEQIKDPSLGILFLSHIVGEILGSDNTGDEAIVNLFAFDWKDRQQILPDIMQANMINHVMIDYYEMEQIVFVAAKLFHLNTMYERYQRCLCPEEESIAA